jgi:biotin synthase
MYAAEIERWLKETDEGALAELWARADQARRDHVGDCVHLRGLIEFSNYCSRQCGYCGLRLDNREVVRYRMSPDEIVMCARDAATFGYGTVVLQSGEDRFYCANTVARIVRRIKDETGLAVTLSLGERHPDELALWRVAGADRYLLRFETSNAALFEAIHPSLPGSSSDRIALLRDLRRLGYEVGSGIMIGIPGQTYADLARDVAMFAELDLDMIGVGPFIPHPRTPLGASAPPVDPDQAPNTELMTYKVIALARITCPNANIPATTALATLNRATGRELGLSRGANVVMPNITPAEYRKSYEIYPEKACLSESASDCNRCMAVRIKLIGRQCGNGRGDSANWTRREAHAEEPIAADSRRACSDAAGIERRTDDGRDEELY